MNIEYIHTLLNKYWDCQTSEAEEKVLQDFFSGNDAPQNLMQYVPLFSFIKEERTVKPSADFDKKLQAAIDAGGNRKKYVTMRIFAPLLRGAASVLLLIGLAASLFLVTRQSNKPQGSETHTDSQSAFKHAARALEKLSDALKISEEVSMQTLREIDELGIDRFLPDSLNNFGSEDLQPKTEENDL